MQGLLKEFRSNNKFCKSKTCMKLADDCYNLVTPRRKGSCHTCLSKPNRL